MKVIFTNDDIGLTTGFTSAILECHSRGLTTSTSVRVNGTDFARAANLIKTKMKGVGIGLHLNLTDGPSFFDDLSNAQGKYKYNFLHYFLFSFIKNRKLERKILQEFEAQYRQLTKGGIRPDHVDSQDHVHMIPPVFEITCKFCKKHKINRVRIADEPFFLSTKIPELKSVLKFIVLKSFSLINKATLAKYNLRSTDAFYGLVYTNNMNGKIIKDALRDALMKGFQTIEVVSHPAFINQNDIVYTSEFIKKYSNLPNRAQEKNALTNKKLITWLNQNGLIKATFKNI